MTYQVLARKWRPKDFSSLVGQEHVVTALQNGLREGRIAQAYLFSGIRGVGKTTAARVLAKALNCERGPAPDPCNECESCTEIGGGSSLDVLEVDAATYSKVEQVRELTESLRYGPARGRYKVVVLDEVHRLSKQAFDALLKIVEEPPPHLVFIFATTEIDAVPATILSRCQEYQFRRVASGLLAEHLRTICTAEEITASDGALRLIARAGEGSVRDSVALLDQMATFGNGTIADEDAQRLLGGLDAAIFQKLLAAILDGEHGPILESVAEVEAKGWDHHHVYSQFLAFLRDALHLTLGAETATVDLPEEEAEAVRRITASRGYEGLLQVLQLLLTSEGMVKRSELGGLALEIAWLRAAELPKVARVQELLSSTPPTGGTPSAPSSTPRRSTPGASSPGRSMASEGGDGFLALDASPPAPLDRRGSMSTTGEPSSTGESTDTPDPARLPMFLELLGSKRQPLVAHLRQAALDFDDRTLVIRPRDSLLRQALDRSSNRQALDASLHEIFGGGTAWRITDIDAPSAPRTAEPIESVIDPGAGPAHAMSRPKIATTRTPTAARSDTAELDDLPLTRSVIDTFGGRLRSLEPAGEIAQGDSR